MNDHEKTRSQLIAELNQLRARNAALEVTEEKYRGLFENLPVGIFQSTPDGRYRLVNPAFAQMAGYDSPAEMIHDVKNISALYANPADREQVKALFARHGHLDGHTIGYRRKGGETGWLSFFAKCVYDEAGAISYYDGFALDITERKQSEEELRYKAVLLDTISDAVITTDLAFNIQSLNLAAEILYGWTTAEAIGKRMGEVIPTSFVHANNEEVISQFWLEGTWRGEAVQQHKNGSNLNVLSSVNLVRDQDGRPITILAVNHDITQRKQAEEDLRASGADLTALLNAPTDSVALIDPEGYLLKINDSGARRFNSTPDALLGVNIFTRLPPRLAESRKAQIDQVFQTSRPVHFIDTRDGRDLSNHVYPIFDNDNKTVTRAAIYAADITEQRQIAEALRKSEEEYRNLFNNALVALFKTAVHTGKILTANSAAARLFGYPSVDAFIAESTGYAQFADASDWEKILQELHQKGRIDRVEMRSLNNSGQKFWSEASFRLNREEDAVECVAYDISQRKQAHEIQKRLTDRLETGLRTGNIAWWEMELPSGKVIFDDRKAEMLGYAPKLFQVFEDFTALLHPDDYGKAMQAMRAHFEGTADTYEVETRLKTATGEYRWFHDIGRLTEKDDATGFMRFVGIVEDITRRKESEEALKQSEARYKSVVSALSEGLVLQDKSGKIVMVNQSAAEILGLTETQLLGRFLYDSHWQALDEHDQPLAPEDHPAMIALQTGKAVDNTVMNIHVGDGKRAIISFNSRSILNSNQEVSGYVATFTDITERKQAENIQKQLTLQLQRQAHQLQLVMESVPEGVLVIDLNGRILLTNPAATQNLAILADGAKIGDTLQQLGDQPLRNLFHHPQTGLRYQLDWQRQIFELVANPLNDSGTLSGWVIVIHDATEEKEIQQRIQQQERLASVGQLAAGIAHDFNNIMAIISLYTDLLLRDSRIPPDTHDRFAVILDQTIRASDLIRQILDFGRRSVMQRHPIDLVPFFKKWVKLFERTLPENLAISLDFNGGDFFVNADPTHLQQVIMNLVVNARDAMPQGGKLIIQLDHLSKQRPSAPRLSQLARRLLQDESQSDWMRISVQDTGSGIDAQIMPHIFEPFYSTKDRSKGAGLGLAQVFGIVQQHKGEIEVSSEIGTGTIFDIYLPALPVSETKQTLVLDVDMPSGHGETILVVEDNPVLLEVTVTILRELRYQTLSAANGLEALQLLTNSQDEIDLILCDLVMPEMGGKELLLAMRRVGLTNKVVIVTGHSVDEEKQEIMALGVVDWLSKPPSLELLAQAVAKAIQRP